MLSPRRLVLALLVAVVLFFIVGVVWDIRQYANRASGPAPISPMVPVGGSAPPVWYTPEPGVYPPPTPTWPAPYAGR